MIRAFILGVIVAASAAPAFAQVATPSANTWENLNSRVEHPETQAKIDMTVVLKDGNGRPAIDGDAANPGTGKPCGVLKIVNDIDQRVSTEGCPVLTLGHAVEHVLYANFPEDKALDPKMKAARARLAEQIADNPAAKLTAPQIALIETLLGRAYGGLILLQTYALLDPNTELPEVK